jgi:hypothetical protein
MEDLGLISTLGFHSDYSFRLQVSGIIIRNGTNLFI